MKARLSVSMTPCVRTCDWSVATEALIGGGVNHMIPPRVPFDLGLAARS